MYPNVLSTRCYYSVNYYITCKHAKRMWYELSQYSPPFKYTVYCPELGIIFINMILMISKDLECDFTLYLHNSLPLSNIHSIDHYSNNPE